MLKQYTSLNLKISYVVSFRLLRFKYIYSSTEINRKVGLDNMGESCERGEGKLANNSILLS